MKHIDFFRYFCLKKIAFIVMVIFLVGCSLGEKKNERWYQQRWCDANQGRMEVRLANGTRCDCLTATHAIEFDFAPKWQEAIGQSLNYGMMTGKRPGIVLICRRPNDKKKFKLLKGLTFSLRGRGVIIRVWDIDCI